MRVDTDDMVRRSASMPISRPPSQRLTVQDVGLGSHAARL
jgi:hypothetical protein